MSRFTKDPLQLILIDDGEGRAETRGGRCTWKVAAPISYDVGAEGSGETITVPAGAATDLASVPRACWTLFPPDGPWLKAAVVHDHLYASKGLGGRYSRAECDAIFREAMAVLGVAAWKRSVIFAAVRLAGGRSWGA